MFVCVPHTCTTRPEKGIGYPGTVAADGCEPPRGYWKSNPGPGIATSNFS